LTRHPEFFHDVKGKAQKNPLKQIAEIVNCMGSSKELYRLVNGLSLIAKELVKRSQALEAAKNGDLQDLIKKAIASATDLSGLTKGKVRSLSNAGSSNPDSVVHFTTTTGNESAEEATPVTFQQQQPSSFDASNDTNNNLREDASSSSSSTSSSSSSSSSSAVENLDTRDGFGSVKEATEDRGINAQVEFKRRKPRERRVPSTPFSRALGSVLFRFYSRMYYI
jgi:aarF domain-containing kinase